MAHVRTHPVPRPRTLAILYTIVLALACTATAQETAPLESVAPPDTILAVGLQPDAAPEGDLHDALAGIDWEGARATLDALAPVLEEIDLDLPIALRALVGGMGGGMAGAGAPDLEAPLAQLEATCPGIGADVGALEENTWASDALLTVSMGAFAPLPAGLIAVRVSDDAADAVAAVQDRLVACFGTGDAGSQDGSTLHVLGDGGDLPMVLARHGDLFLAGTRPDVVRAAIRRAGGAEERSFADTRTGAAAAEFGPGLRIALQTTVLADLLETRLPPMGGEAVAVARERGVAALRTFGGTAVRVGLEPEGFAAESVVTFDPEGGDEQLAALLACNECRPGGPFLAPADAVAVSGRPWRPAAWVRYLDSWVRDLSAAAGEETDLRTLVSETAGVDLDVALLDWVGNEVQSIRLAPLSTDLRDLVGQPPSAVVFPVASAEAAEAGLQALGDAALSLLGAAEAMGVSDLPTPEDVQAMLSVREEALGDASYTRIRVGPTTDLAVGTIGNRLVVATPSSAYRTILAVHRGEVRNGFASEGWQAVTEMAEDGRIAWSYGDGGADLVGLANLLDLAVQPLAFAASAGLEAGLQPDTGADAPMDPFGDDSFGDDGFGGMSMTGGTVVDVATASGFGDLDLGDVEPPSLSVPGEVQGTLDGDATNFDGTGMDLYRLEGLQAGGTVTVEMTSDAFDTYLYLIDADGGRYLAEDDDSPSTSRSAIQLTADGTTELFVGASSWAGGGEGSYTLSVSEGASEPADPFGATSGGALDVSTASGYGSVPTQELEASPLQVPASVSHELSMDAEDATYLNGDLTDFYRLEGLNAGDVVSVEMTSEPIDTYLYLIDADAGTILQEIDDSPTTRRSALTFTADGLSELWIGAGSWSGMSEGPYDLSVTVDAAAADAEAGDAADGTDASGAAPATESAGGDVDADVPAEDPADGGPATEEAAEEDEEEAPEPPSFDRLLTLFEVGPDALRLIGERLGLYASVTTVEDDTVRTVHRQAFDW